jgi:HK97 family phage prohead protease
MADKFDFSGWATKYDVKCSDGRTIKKGAFKHLDGSVVPMVWGHLHDDPKNFLGKVTLQHRDEGIYAYGKFNDLEPAQDAKVLVEHGDITSLSIYANHLKQSGNDVMHGMIREVSLVMAGANSEARIENVAMQHGDSYEDVPDEAIIHTAFDDGLSLSDLEIFEDDVEHADAAPADPAPAAGSGMTLGDVFGTMTEEQKTAVYALLNDVIQNQQAPASEEAVAQSDQDDQVIEHNEEENEDMKPNTFDAETVVQHSEHLTPEQLGQIIKTATKCGSFKDAILAHADDYGITNIDLLFPDARALSNTPEFIKRRTEWVSMVLNGVHHTPFSRIKSLVADITEDEARAKGYIKGNMKKEEVFPVMKRVTTPVTIYKKQKLDRDDIIDITELDVVMWIKQEMRLMLDEEIARAILIGDGRAVDDTDKINETNVRPIYTDDQLYSVKVAPLANTATAEDMIDAIIKARKFYKGTGNPTFFTTTDVMSDMLLIKDSLGRRIYESEASLLSVLRVARIVEVEVMEGAKRVDGANTYDLLGILVNLQDYNVGADRGGNVSMFDDFDIDYNQYKYLIETRISGALTKPFSALVIEKQAAAG